MCPFISRIHQKCFSSQQYVSPELMINKPFSDAKSKIYFQYNKKTYTSEFLSYTD